MIIIAVKLNGCQSKTHCSKAWSIDACEKLSNYGVAQCKLYKLKLVYDWDEYAYRRCEMCTKSEIAQQRRKISIKVARQ